MFILSWEDKYNTGIDSIDEEHQNLFTMVNVFGMNMDKKKDYAMAIEMMNNLVHYTLTHFQREEVFMSISSYPEIGIHKAMHKEICFRLKSLEVGMKNEKEFESVVDELLNMLSDWLKIHIVKEDMEFGAYYNKWLG